MRLEYRGGAIQYFYVHGVPENNGNGFLVALLDVRTWTRTEADNIQNLAFLVMVIADSMKNETCALLAVQSLQIYAQGSYILIVVVHE